MTTETITRHSHERTIQPIKDILANARQWVIDKAQGALGLVQKPHLADINEYTPEEPPMILRNLRPDIYRQVEATIQREQVERNSPAALAEELRKLKAGDTSDLPSAQNSAALEQATTTLFSRKSL